MEKKPILRKPIYTNSEKNYNPVRKKLCLQIGSGFRIVFGYTFITLLPRGEILFLTSGTFSHDYIRAKNNMVPVAISIQNDIPIILYILSHFIS
jgi:hypothetical protein